MDQFWGEGQPELYSLSDWYKISVRSRPEERAHSGVAKGSGGSVGTSDAFRFVYQPITGNSTIIAVFPAQLYLISGCSLVDHGAEVSSTERTGKIFKIAGFREPWRFSALKESSCFRPF
jgi:hypothetical protein